MNPEPIDSSNPSSSGTVVLVLGFLTLLYFMYDNLERKIVTCREHFVVTDSRFNVVEDKLATLNEVEEDVGKLKEAEEERKSSWEDDVTEPNKYQAILGTGTVDGVEYQFRFIREKLNSFKSNRYWLMSEIPKAFIHDFLFHHFFPTQQTYETYKNSILHQYKPCDIDCFIRLECAILKNPLNKSEVNFHEVYEAARSMDASPFKWKRALITVESD